MHDAVLRLVARTLPRAVRARYLEEWRADAGAAAEVGLRRGAVVRGAAVLALTMDRDLPARTGEPRGAVPRRLARRGLALLATAVALVGATLVEGDVGSAVTGAPLQSVAVLSAVAWVCVRAALLAVLVGVLYLGSAAIVARGPLARAAWAGAAVGPVVMALAVLGEAGRVVLLAGVGLTSLGFLAGLALVTGSSPFSLAPRTAGRAQRLPVAVCGLVLVAVVLTVGVLDLLVWNPEAKVPALDAAAIYSQMRSTGQLEPWVVIVQVASWAAFWGGLAVALVVVAARPGPSWLTPRRGSILALGIVAGAVLFRFFAGFSLSMSIADTFGTSGAAASTASGVLACAGWLALAGVVVLLGWAPKVTGTGADLTREPLAPVHPEP